MPNNLFSSYHRTSCKFSLDGMGTLKQVDIQSFGASYLALVLLKKSQLCSSNKLIIYQLN